MASTGESIRLRLRWIQILDNLEAFYKDRGEFRFTARVSDGAGGQVLAERTLPREGYYALTDRPGWNRLELDEVIYEGPVTGGVVVEFEGIELDDVTSHDHLESYRRVFEGPVAQWLGRYGPGEMEADVDSSDPENMKSWRLCYTIEPATS